MVSNGVPDLMEFCLQDFAEEQNHPHSISWLQDLAEEQDLQSSNSDQFKNLLIGAACRTVQKSRIWWQGSQVRSCM